MSVTIDGTNGVSLVAANGVPITAIQDNVSALFGLKNKIINGNFGFWQRGTSVTGVASAQYVADRWNCNLLGSTANVSRQSFTLGQTDVPYEPTYFHRTVVSSVVGASNYYLLSQKIESVRTLAGQTATLSFWAKADASKNISVEFAQSFGTGGSPSSGVTNLGVTTCALTTSWKKFTVTVSLPSITGKTLGTDNNDILSVLFWFDAGSTFNSRTNSLGQQSGTFDIAQVQLEAGSKATSFEMRPPGLELSLCQRHYQFWSAAWSGISGGVNYKYSSTASFSTEMRAVPTVGVVSQTNSARFPSSTYITPIISRNGVTASYAAQSSGGNDTWYVDGTAESEL